MFRKKLPGLLMIVCFGQVLPAQQDTNEARKMLDWDKNRFEKILNQETSQAQSDHDDRHKYYLIPEDLPDWFFNPSTCAGSAKYMIGVSDPGLDSAEAFRSAILRAKALFLLSERMQVENLSDNFNVAREFRSEFDQYSKYLDFTRITAKAHYSPEDFEVRKKYYTKYGEGIVLVGFQHNSDIKEDTLSISGEIMQLAREDNISLKNTAFCRFDLNNRPRQNQSDSNDMHYMYRAQDSRFNVISTWDGDTIDYPSHPYRYFSSRDSLKESEDKIYHGFSSGSGLWNAYINSLLSQLTYYNKYLDSRVKTTYDNYTQKNQEIVRTVSRNILNFKLSGLDIIDQKLFLHLKFNGEKRKK